MQIGEKTMKTVKQIEAELGRELNPEEGLVAVAALYLHQRDKLAAACQALVDWSHIDPRESGGDFNHLAVVVIPRAVEALESITAEQLSDNWRCTNCRIPRQTTTSKPDYFDFGWTAGLDLDRFLD